MSTEPDPEPVTEGGSIAARHALGWLTAANMVGVWLAAQLVWPRLGSLAGSLGYGRWVPLHLNLQLYGWTSLPLIGWLLVVYRADGGPAARWSAPVVRAWSAALVIGALFWVSGHTSGKLFLDWQGGSLAAFIAAQILLWLLLGLAWWFDPRRGLARVARLLGLVFLATVPVAMMMAASPCSYPPFDRTTGGPSGGSLLGSTLPVVLLLLWTPRALGLSRTGGSSRWMTALWLLEAVVFGVLEKTGGTHHMVRQIAGLALLLPWLVLVPLDWRRFTWPAGSVFWRNSALVWWGLLIVAGWLEYLPGFLDRMKFTSGLVAHAHLAMAGFTSAFGLLLVTLIGGSAASAAVSRGGRWWNAAVAAHVIALLACGWLEGGGAAWMDHRPVWREAAFLIRLASGIVMTGIAMDWWRRSRIVPRVISEP